MSETIQISQTHHPIAVFWAKTSRVALPTLWAAGLILVWQYSVQWFDVPDYILPSPTEAIGRLISDWNVIFEQAIDTSSMVVAGFLIGALLAVPLGLLIASVRVVELCVYPIIVFLQVIPKIAISPLLIIWLGFGSGPKIILTVFLTFFPVLVDSIAGFKSVDQRVLYLSRSAGATGWQTFRYIRLPTAMPFIYSGLKISIVLAVTAVIVSEFVGSNSGLGYLLIRAISNSDLSLMFAVILMSTFIGLILNAIVRASQYLLMPWQHPRTGAAVG